MPPGRRSTPSSTARSTADDYTVEKVYFESHARAFRHRQPLPAEERRRQACPASSVPHGHWPNGRFTMRGSDAEREEGDRDGAENVRARRPLPAAGPLRAARPHGLRRSSIRHARLRRQRADLAQLAHGFAKQRPEMNSPRTGAFSAPGGGAVCRASWACRPGTPSARSISSRRCPTSIRSASAVTGASGGGTQTLHARAPSTPRLDALRFPP